MCNLLAVVMFRHLMDERMEGIFEPDTLLASQYFDRVRGRTATDPERRLMVAVLEDAVHVYLKHVGATSEPARELFEEAAEWIEDRDATWFYSFENVCAVLDIDADYIRRGLRGHRRRVASATAPAALPAAEAVDFKRASGE